jgi:hypothetical protein
MRQVAAPKENGSAAAAAETRQEVAEESGPANEAGAKKTTARAPVGFFPRGVVLVPMILLIFAAGTLVGIRWQVSRASAVEAKNTDPAESFWRGFFTSDSAPVVGYADAVYLVDGAEDLFRFRRGASDNTGTLVEPHLAQQFASSPDLVAKAGPLYYEDGNTGTGDLESVFALTKLFTRMNLQMSVKRCRLITIDDLRQAGTEDGLRTHHPTAGRRAESIYCGAGWTGYVRCGGNGAVYDFAHRHGGTEGPAELSEWMDGRRRAPVVSGALARGCAKGA